MDDLNQTVVIGADWTPMDYEGISPKGKRDKERYTSPQASPFEQIKPQWPYLFKKAFARHPWQFWVEIIAYRLSKIFGVEVPPAFLGRIDTNNNPPDDKPTFGALIEWFYDPQNDGYIEGGDILIAHIPGFDRRKGRQHNLEALASNVFDRLEASVFSLTDDSERH